MMNCKKVLALGLLILGLAAKAHASIAVSSSSVAGVVVIAAPVSPAAKTYVKSITLANDTSTALCVVLKDGSTQKLMLCAGAQAHNIWPNGVPNVNAGSGPNGAASAFLGENLLISGAFNVLSSTPIALGNAGGSVTVSYDQR